MRYNAVIYTAEPVTSRSGTAAVLDEIGSVGARQIADRGLLTSRLYTAALARAGAFPPGQPVWVVREGEAGPETFVAYPVLQKGRTMRLHRREGELVPGVLLESLGTYERSGSPMVTGGGAAGGEWFVTQDGPNVYRTSDFRLYEDVPSLRGRLNGPLCWAGRLLVAGGEGEVFATADGVTWQTYPAPAAADIWALAWDGAAVWIAAEGGTFTLDLATGTISQVASQPAHGLTYQFMNFDLYRAGAVAGGGYEILIRNGDAYRSLDLDLAGLTHNWVVLDGLHYVADKAGEVWRFDADTLTPLGTLHALGRNGDWAASTFLIRDTVFAVSHGRLARISGDTLRIAYDFGGDVRAYPVQGGFIAVRADGLLYRVRRA